jgi:hypothetical protein
VTTQALVTGKGQAPGRLLETTVEGAVPSGGLRFDGRADVDHFSKQLALLVSLLDRSFIAASARIDSRSRANPERYGPLFRRFAIRLDPRPLRARVDSC